MKKSLIIISLFFIKFSIYSEDTLQSDDIDKDLYGFTLEVDSLYNDDSYNQFISFQNDFFQEFGSIRNDKKLKGIEKYFDLINDKSLKGNLLKDTLLLYIPDESTNQLVSILKEYNKKAKSDIITNIIDAKTTKKNVSPFCFTTMLNAKMLAHDVVMLMPNSEWKVFNSDKEPIFYIAGDDYYSGTVSITKVKNNNIIEDKNNYLPSMVQLPTKKGEKVSFYSLEKNKIILILDKESVIGNKKFNRIYEQITVSPKGNDFQLYVERSRYYEEEKHYYKVSVTSVIAGINVLADRNSLIKSQGLLLDTLTFVEGK